MIQQKLAWHFNDMMMIVIDEDYNDDYNPKIHEDLMDPLPDDVCYEKSA